MLIRRACAGDERQIAHVHTESWKTTYRGIVPDAFLDRLTIESRLPQWEQALCEQGEERIVLVAEQEDGTIVGFASGGKEREGSLPYEGELYALYILKAMQQVGIGRQLATSMVRELQQLGMGSMVIWALEQNPACRFYEKMGGMPVRKQPITIAGRELVEVAFGWKRLEPFGEGMKMADDGEPRID